MRIAEARTWLRQRGGVFLKSRIRGGAAIIVVALGATSFTVTVDDDTDDRDDVALTHAIERLEAKRHGT